MNRHRRYAGPSEAQSVALAMREAPYTEAHRNSYVLKMERTDPPEDLRAVIHQLRKAYADEVPGRMHKHETSEGGTPEWTAGFARYITGSDMATDKDDDTYQTPFRAALSGMPTERRMLVECVVVTGMGPVESAKVMEVPEWCAKIVADSVLRTFWKRLSDVRLDLRSERVA